MRRISRETRDGIHSLWDDVQNIEGGMRMLEILWGRERLPVSGVLVFFYPFQLLTAPQDRKEHRAEESSERKNFQLQMEESLLGRKKRDVGDR